jgi:DNA-binding transcriptional LysR family regulator
VRIHANASALAQYLPGDLATFSAAHPEIKLALEEERSGAIVEAVRKGAADVGIVMEGADAPGLQLFEYRTDLLCAVVPRRHPVKERRIAFARLLDHDFVGLESNTVISRLLLEEAARAGQAPAPARPGEELRRRWRASCRRASASGSSRGCRQRLRQAHGACASSPSPMRGRPAACSWR